MLLGGRSPESANEGVSGDGFRGERGRREWERVAQDKAGSAEDKSSIRRGCIWRRIECNRREGRRRRSHMYDRGSEMLHWNFFF